MDTRPLASSLLMNCETKRSIYATRRSATSKRGRFTISPQTPLTPQQTCGVVLRQRDFCLADRIF